MAGPPAAGAKFDGYRPRKPLPLRGPRCRPDRSARTDPPGAIRPDRCLDRRRGRRPAGGRIAGVVAVGTGARGRIAGSGGTGWSGALDTASEPRTRHFVSQVPMWCTNPASRPMLSQLTAGPLVIECDDLTSTVDPYGELVWVNCMGCRWCGEYA